MTLDVRQRDRFRQTAALFWSGLILSSVLLLSRRVAGGFSSPLNFVPLLFVTSVVAGLSLLAWINFRLGTQRDQRRQPTDRFAGFLTVLPTILTGIAVMPVQSPFAIGWLFGLTGLLIGSVIVAGDFFATANQATGHRETTRQPLPLSATVAEGSPTSAESLAVFDPAGNESANPNVTQWMTRQSLPDGSENLEGAARAFFAAGQRAVSIHIPFTPPFAAAPVVECEIVSDEPARWKVSVVYAYGMRVELKRDHSTESAEIELAYSATCQSTQSDAA